MIGSPGVVGSTVTGLPILLVAGSVLVVFGSSVVGSPVLVVVVGSPVLVVVGSSVVGSPVLGVVGSGVVGSPVLVVVGSTVGLVGSPVLELVTVIAVAWLLNLTSAMCTHSIWAPEGLLNSMK